MMPLLDDAKTQRKIVNENTVFLDKLFPAGLDATYNRMLRDILERQYKKYPRQVTVDILRCLAVAMRPMASIELEDITGFGKDTVRDTLDAFRPILAPRKKNEEVELIHLLLRKYLARNLSNMLLVDIWWSAWPALYSSVTWLHGQCFQLWMFEKCVVLMQDTNKCLKEDICDLEDPGPLKSKDTALKASVFCVSNMHVGTEFDISNEVMRGHATCTRHMTFFVEVSLSG